MSGLAGIVVGIIAVAVGLAVVGLLVEWIDRELDGPRGRRYHGPGWGDD